MAALSAGDYAQYKGVTYELWSVEKNKTGQIMAVIEYADSIEKRGNLSRFASVPVGELTAVTNKDTIKKLQLRTRNASMS